MYHQAIRNYQEYFTDSRLSRYFLSMKNECTEIPHLNVNYKCWRKIDHAKQTVSIGYGEDKY